MSEPGRSARFTALDTRQYARVHAFAHRRTGNGSEAEEIAAEVFRTAREHTLRGAEPTPGWLFVTTRNVLGNHYTATARLTDLRRRVGDKVGRPPASTAVSAVVSGGKAVAGEDNPVPLSPAVLQALGLTG